MKYILFLLALWSSMAHADWLCLPKTALTPFAEGSAKVLAVTPAAESHAWWCQEATPAGAVRFFRPQYFTVLNKHRRAIDPFTVLQRAAAASAPMEKALSIEAAAAQIIPITGSQDEYDYLTARYQACLKLSTVPYLVPIDPLPANWCGAAPIAPGPAPDVWRTPPSGAFTLFIAADGKLKSIIAGRKATPNALCDCSAPVMSGTSAYCPLAGAVTTEVTLCKKAAP